MKLENQVTSLKLSKKLKKLGVKQESLFYWVNGKLFLKDKDDLVNEHISAFTASELGERLPMELPEDNDYVFETLCLSGSWVVQYNPHLHRKKVFGQVAKTEANARAKMLIYLIENKL